MDRCPKCGWHHTDECMGENMVADHNPAIPRTRTPILISAMRLLARDIQSEDGVANAAIAEAGNRLADLDEELERSNKFLEDAKAAFKAKVDALEAQLTKAQQGIGEDITRPHDGPENCPTYYDGCNCTVEALVHNIERARKAEARITELEKERADILRLAGECYTPVSLAAHVGSTRWDWEQAHKLLDAAGVPDNLTLGDRIQALLNR